MTVEKLREVKVTKRALLREVNNDKAHNYYYDVYIRIYSAERERVYYKFNFVLWFDAESVGEYFQVDYITKKQISEYLNELIYSFVFNLNDTSKFAEFRQKCIDSINEYNKCIRANNTQNIY